MLTPSKTTSPYKLFPSDCMSLHCIYNALDSEKIYTFCGAAGFFFFRSHQNINLLKKKRFLYYADLKEAALEKSCRGYCHCVLKIFLIM